LSSSSPTPVTADTETAAGRSAGRAVRSFFVATSTTGAVALAELEGFHDARGKGVDAAAAATHLQAAVGALDDLIGVVTPDDVLDRVFASFCVGK